MSIDLQGSASIQLRYGRRNFGGKLKRRIHCFNRFPFLHQGPEAEPEGTRRASPRTTSSSATRRTRSRGLSSTTTRASPPRKHRCLEHSLFFLKQGRNFSFLSSSDSFKVESPQRNILFLQAVRRGGATRTGR